MNKILAFDLVWSGPTGWCLFDRELGEFEMWGLIEPGTGDTLKVTKALYNQLLSVMYRCDASHVCYEITDWHRSIDGRNYKQQFAIERRVQRALGKAEGVFCTLCLFMRVTPTEMPATQTRNKFGARSKIAAAHLLAEEFGFEFTDNEENPIAIDGERVSNNITDAMVLAVVLDRELRQEEMIAASV